MKKRDVKPDRERLKISEKFSPGSRKEKEVIELLQMMIQTDTSNPPGNETVLAEKLKDYIDKKGFDNVKTKIIESKPTRGSLIITIDGSNPDKYPTWGFMSHLDVVPAEGRWKHPPFSGEIVNDEHDKFIWGRGALDIKSMGASHVTAALTLLEEGFIPRGTIKILLCADEEQGGHWGLEYLLEHHFDDVRVDCCINEGGGFKLPINNDFVIQVGEKGVFWTKLRIRGEAGHGSMPPAYEKFAIYRMMQVLERIRKYKKKIEIKEEYLNMINGLSLPSFIKVLLKKRRLLPGLVKLASKITKIDINRVIMPLVTDSIAPTNFHSGSKENSISPVAEVILDIRTLPAHDRDTVTKMLEEAIGKELWNDLEWEGLENQACTVSSINNSYFDKIRETLNEIYDGSKLIPFLSQGSTDSKFFRDKGITCYGFCPAVKDEDLSFSDLLSLAHNENERISLLNLMLAVDFTYRIMKKV
ncbi:MAG: M20/M25/M40 family metallo-hydrolase [Promethearchaeota archaeon]